MNMNSGAILVVSALLFLGLAPLGSETQTKIAPNNQNKAIKNAGGHNRILMNGTARLGVTVRGEGDTVIMLPSLGRSVRDFDQISERLAANNFRVVLPEPRGIGQSTGPTDNLTLHDLADDIAMIIKT